MTDAAIIDPNDRQTWPPVVIDWTTHWAERLRGTTEYTSDLRISHEDEHEWRKRLSGAKLLAYHCTRLLDHEVDQVRTEGLRVLTRDLVERKIEEAYSVGALSTEDHDELLRLHTFARGQHENRENRICLIVGSDTFATADNVGGCLPLLTIWGGEGINMGADRDLEARLGAIGHSTVVVAAVNLGEPHFAFCLGRAFVGIELGLDDAFQEIHYFVAIPPSDVIAVLQPGTPDYDARPHLPR